jgi:hypothetical protein
VSTEHLWNDTDKGKLKYSETNMSQRHFVQHKYHIDWPGIKLGPLKRKVVDWLPETFHGAMCANKGEQLKK